MISNTVLNYYTRKAERKIIIDGINISITADLINNELVYFSKNKMHKLNFRNIKRETTHLAMHKDILFSKKTICCSYNESLMIQKLINKIKSR